MSYEIHISLFINIKKIQNNHNLFLFTLFCVSVHEVRAYHLQPLSNVAPDIKAGSCEVESEIWPWLMLLDETIYSMRTLNLS